MKTIKEWPRQCGKTWMMAVEMERGNLVNNFSPFDKPYVKDGTAYPTPEHFFQAQKCLDMIDRMRIASAPGAGRAKAIGQRVPLRKDWEEVKQDAMEEALRWKFREGTPAREALISTGSEKLVEWNSWHDNIWGHCTCKMCKDKEHKNYLGKILMKLRAEFISE